MPLPILGLHHVTSKSSSPIETDRFWQQTMGLPRIKKTVNFDNPKVYHLYYGADNGVPGTVMTYFPFPDLTRGARGVGEVASVDFSVAPGVLDYWEARLEAAGALPARGEWFGRETLEFHAPDGDMFRLVEKASDVRAKSSELSIRGFDAACLCLQEIETTAEILTAFGYQEIGSDGNTTRFELPVHNGAGAIDLKAAPQMPVAVEGAGSVHHIAFAVKDRAAQLEVREAMLTAGQKVTGVRDRNYFHAIYFRTPGGVLFEVATHEPGFDVDEPVEDLGAALKLPAQHEHLRDQLVQSLVPLD